MLEQLKQLVAAHIENGGLEDEIEKCTFEIIDSQEFEDMPEALQNTIYQLNMYDVNELTKEQFQQLLDELKGL